MSDDYPVYIYPDQVLDTEIEETHTQIMVETEHFMYGAVPSLGDCPATVTEFYDENTN